LAREMDGTPASDFLRGVGWKVPSSHGGSIPVGRMGGVAFESSTSVLPVCYSPWITGMT
jgi:hypothetical protein